MSERKERLKAAAKVREEIRNAVRLTMFEKGVSPDHINRAAQDMARQATDKATKKVVAEIGEFVKNKNFKELVREIVLQEMKEQFNSVGLRDVLKAYIQQEASEIAKKYVEKHIQVRFMGGEW